MALAAWSGLPSAPLFAAARANDRIADGEAEPFSFQGLRERARTLATRPYRDAARALPPTLAGLTPHQYNEIGYDAEHALWPGLRWQIQRQDSPRLASDATQDTRL